MKVQRLTFAKGQPTDDQIFKSIETLTGQHIVCFHEEANNYAYKIWSTGQWCTVNKDFLNGIAIFK